MSTTTFTPEPLFVKDRSEIISGKRVGTLDILNREQHEEGYKWIGDVKPYGGVFPDHEEAKAYAKLFAASPDMLKAIQCALNLKDLWSAHQHGTISADHAGEMEALQKMQDKLEAALAKATT